MLPFELTWYRRIIGFAVLLGAAGGVYGLIYLGVTGAMIDGFFGDAGTTWWSGEWWWIPLITAGGLIVAALRQLWGEVPPSGSVASSSIMARRCFSRRRPLVRTARRRHRPLLGLRHWLSAFSDRSHWRGAR